MRQLRFYLPVSALALAVSAGLVGCAAPGVLVPPPPVVDTPPHVEDEEITYDPHGLPEGAGPVLTPDRAILTRLGTAHQAWNGTPYRFGGTSRNGIDCSAFVQRVFDEAFGHQLTRSTATQVQEGQKVRREDLQPGDLVFFRTGKRQRHVGIYLQGGRFLHASSRRGVTTDRLHGFYDRTYWTARRVLPAELVASLVEPTSPPPVHLAADDPARTPARTRATVERSAPAAEAPAGSDSRTPRRSGW